MSNAKLVVSLVAASVMVSACAKGRSPKGAAGKPAASARPENAGEIKIDPPPEEKGETRAGNRPQRFSNDDEATRRFDNSRYTEVPDQDHADDGDIADNNPPPEENPNETPNEQPGEHPAGPREGKVQPGSVARQGDQCGTAFGINDEAWAPGLPEAPATQRICTGYSAGKFDDKQAFQCENNPDAVYTDAGRDGLMAMAIGQANRLPKNMDAGSRNLAKRVRDLKISAARGRGEVRAQIALLVNRGQFAKFEFRGAKSGARNERGIQMIALNAPNNLRFSAVLTCADADGGCDNSIFRLQQLNTAGKVARVVFVVNRAGKAHVSITEQDRTGDPAAIKNQAHAHFAKFLSNTVYNTCSALLREAVNGRRQMNACAVQRLKSMCGQRAAFKQPAAKDFQLRTWAVAYGRAGFEFEMIDGSMPKFLVKGPLVAKLAPPMGEGALQVSGEYAEGLEHAILVANDGGGNLNLQLSFKGATSSLTRLNISSMLEGIRFGNEAVLSRANQMPTLTDADYATENDNREPAPQAAPPKGPSVRAAGRPAPPSKAATEAKAEVKATAPAVKPAPAAKPATAQTAPKAAAAAPVTSAPTGGPADAPRSGAPKAKPAIAAPAAPAAQAPAGKLVKAPLPPPRPKFAGDPAPTPAAAPATPAKPAAQEQVAPSAPQTSAPATGVPAREAEDNLVVQPHDDAIAN